MSILGLRQHQTPSLPSASTLATFRATCNTVQPFPFPIISNLRVPSLHSLRSKIVILQSNTLLSVFVATPDDTLPSCCNYLVVPQAIELRHYIPHASSHVAIHASATHPGHTVRRLRNSPCLFPSLAESRQVVFLDLSISPVSHIVPLTKNDIFHCHIPSSLIHDPHIFCPAYIRTTDNDTKTLTPPRAERTAFQTRVSTLPLDFVKSHSTLNFSP